MKKRKRFFKTLNIPFKFFSKVGTIPIKFVYNRKEKLIKIVSPSNIKIIGVKIYRSGKKIIVTFVVTFLILTSSGVVEKVSERSFTVPMNESNREIILVKAGDSHTPTPPTRGSAPTGPSHFPTPPSGNRPSRPVRGANPYIYRPMPKVIDRGLGGAANPAGAGGNGGGGNAEFDDKFAFLKFDKENSQQSKTYDYRSNDPKKKKQSEDQCPIDEQNKAGIDELPDSLKYLYEIEGKAAKQELQRVWKDPETKKETLSKLKKINNGELTPRNQKSLTGFKKLKEYKFNKIRIIVNPGQKGGPDTIVAIVKRSRLDNLMKTFKNKFD